MHAWSAGGSNLSKEWAVVRGKEGIHVFKSWVQFSSHFSSVRAVNKCLLRPVHINATELTHCSRSLRICNHLRDNRQNRLTRFICKLFCMDDVCRCPNRCIFSFCLKVFNDRLEWWQTVKWWRSLKSKTPYCLIYVGQWHNYREAIAPGCSRQGGTEQPHEKANKHKRQSDEWEKVASRNKLLLFLLPTFGH